MPATIPSYGQTTFARWAAERAELQKVIDHERNEIVRLMNELDAEKNRTAEMEATAKRERGKRTLNAWHALRYRQRIADVFEGIRIAADQHEAVKENAACKALWNVALREKCSCVAHDADTDKVLRQCPECDGTGKVEGGFEKCGESDSATSEYVCEECGGEGSVEVHCRVCDR